MIFFAILSNTTRYRSNKSIPRRLKPTPSLEEKSETHRNKRNISFSMSSILELYKTHVSSSSLGTFKKETSSSFLLFVLACSNTSLGVKAAAMTSSPTTPMYFSPHILRRVIQSSQQSTLEISSSSGTSRTYELWDFLEFIDFLHEKSVLFYVGLAQPLTAGWSDSYLRWP